MAKKKPNKKLPAQNKTHLETQIYSEQSQSLFAGPIPPPNVLSDYNKIFPGSAEIIFEVFHSDTIHEQKMEERILEIRSKEIRLGQIFAFLVTLAAFTTSIWMVYLGAHAVAGVIGGTTVVGLVSAFIYGGQKKRISSKTTLNKTNN